MLKTLFINFCIMITLTTLFGAAAGARPDLPTRLTGVLKHWALTAAASLILMQFPVQFPDGVILALHAVSVALAGLYGGPLWGIGVGLPVALYRYSLGGAGAIPGMLHILLAGIVAGLLQVGGSGFSRPYHQLAWRALVTFLVANATILLIPQMGLQYMKQYGPIMTLLHSSGLLVCIHVLRTRFEAAEHLSHARHLAQLDHLTGLPNRRAMEAALSRDIRQAGSFLLLDVDHFKRVNDTYGHAAGDAVLQEVGHLIHREVREDDLVCRYGGEEFAVLLHRCPVARAAEVADRIRKSVEAHRFDTPIGTVRVTISGGLTYVGGTHDLGAQIAQADRLLYQAKAGGRNRIVSASARTA